jgi:hypothetical protein
MSLYVWKDINQNANSYFEYWYGREGKTKNFYLLLYAFMYRLILTNHFIIKSVMMGLVTLGLASMRT